MKRDKTINGIENNVNLQNDAVEVMDLLFITLLLPVTAMPCYGDTSTPTRGQGGEISLLHDILWHMLTLCM